MKSIRRLGWGTATGAVMAAALGGVVACGDSFGGDTDCKTSHTCEPVGGSPSSAGSDDGAGADSGSPAGGVGNSSSGGAPDDGEAECAAAADCDNGDASDGVEGCFNGKCVPGNLAPTIVAVTPEDEATGVEPDGTIVIEVSEALDEATITNTNIKLLDRSRAVPSKITYANKKITVTPDEPLALLVPYEVLISTALTDAEGAGLAQQFSSTFQVRDGAWALTTIEDGDIQGHSSTLQLNAKGEALVAWLGAPATPCPTRARWYLAGQPSGAPKELTYAYDHYCRDVRAAVSPAGLAVVSWFEESTTANAIASAEFRDGKWALATERSTRYDDSGAVAASDDGVMHYFGANGTDVQVWSTNTDGVWVKQGQLLATHDLVSEPSVATAANGKAVAAWKAKEAGDAFKIVASRFSPESGTWGSAVLVPGSAATQSGAGFERGAPQVALDADGNPMLLWQRGAEMVSTLFSAAQDTWTGWTVASSTLTGFPVQELGDGESPALVFDGQTFVAAFTAFVGKQYNVYVVHYDAEQGAWAAPELVSDAMLPGIARMPKLTADAHGNLLVVWSSPAKQTGTFGLAFQRFDASAGTWSGAQPVAEAVITGADFAKGRGNLALGGNASGLAALAFADVSTTGPTNNLRLASFY